ncbi:MAG: hypothetical protein ACTTKH_01305 [Treponema sp.]
MENKVNGDESSLKEPALKIFTIKNQNAKSKDVTFKGTSVTINKKEVSIIFEGKDVPEEFTCNKTFPITIEAGKGDETLEFQTQKTEKYRSCKLIVVVRCTNLEILKDSLITVHGEKVRDDGIVEISEEKVEVKESDVKVQFVQSEALPSLAFEGLPITLKAGKTYTFKIKTVATPKYEKFNRTITIICKGKGELKGLKLKKITVHGEEVKDDVVLLPLQYTTVTKENIRAYFEEDDAPKEVLCEPKSLTVGATEQDLTIYTVATSKYKKFERTIKVKHQEKKKLHLKALTIHGRSVSSKKVTIKEVAVTKDNVSLVFVEKDEVPVNFKLEPQPFTLNHNESKTLTISTEATEKYKAWHIEFEVKREKEESAEKTIDDAVEALRGKLTWVDSLVDKNIQLLTTIEGFEHSTVSWKSLNHKYCDDVGKIKKNIVDLKVELEATVEWKGQERKVKFATTIERIKQIRVKEDEGSETHTEGWDFSEENMLSLLKDDKVIAKFELKNVDIEKKQFEAQLKKRAKLDGTLINLEDWVNPRIEELINFIKEVIFGPTFIKLSTQSTVTWEEFRAYCLLIYTFLQQGITDEELFGKVRSLFGNYAGSWDNFNALSSEEKTKLIKNALKSIREHYLEDHVGISCDAPDAELATKLQELLLLKEKYKLDILGELLAYSYELKEELVEPKYIDNFSFNTVAKYDNQKEWHNQNGVYIWEFGEEIVMSSNKRLNALYVNVEIKRKLWSEKFSYPMPNMFTLKGNRKEWKDLNCTISDIEENGRLTLKTRGGEDGLYGMKFIGRSLEYFLDFFCR